MKILAFGHRQRVGKSSLTRFLISELRIRTKGINVVQAGFADKVKNVSHQLFGWAGLKPGPYYEDHYEEKNSILPLLNKTPRQCWIGVGNGIRQAVDYDGTWGDYLFHNIKADLLIISDLRFIAEANDILKYGGFIYRIDRDSEPKVSDGADDPLSDYDKWTGIIHNNGNLNDLHKEAIKLIEKHFVC